VGINVKDKFMKPITVVVILSLVICFYACGPKPRVWMEPETAGPGYELFSRAEEMFQEKSYEKALTAYKEYLIQFPNRPLAGAALMKIGDIKMALERNPEAREVYYRVITEYSDSPYVDDAKINILLTYYNQMGYLEVIEAATGYLQEVVSRRHILRIYVILGDAYMALGSPTDAVSYYAKAFQTSTDPEKKSIILKLKDAFGLLGSEEIVYLLDRLEDKVTAGYLLYQLGLNSAEEEKYDEAIMVLSKFVEKFPGHENIQQAKSLIVEINKKTVYSRYTVGCLLPLSGLYKTFGHKALKGVELALSQFSAQNTQPTIKIIVKDTGSDPVMAALGVRELFDENIAAIIGPIITAESAALAAQESRIPIVTLTQKDKITEIGDYVFRNFFTPRMQVNALVSYAVEDLGLSNFAILYPDENYGSTFMNLFWDAVIAYGGKVVGVEAYDSSSTDFADPIKKLVGLYYEVPEDLRALETLGEKNQDENPGAVEISATDVLPEFMEDERVKDEEMDGDEEPKPIVDFDAIFIPDAPQKAGLIIPQLAYYDVDDSYLLGTNLWHSDSLIEMSRQYIQDAILTDGFFAESASEHVQRFVRLFQEAFGEQPEFIEAVAYDTAMILFQTISQPDIRFRNMLKNELLKLTNYQGVTGITTFDSSGDVHDKLHLLQIKGRRFVEVEPY
jgi:ABC-type branched-subunit amino acid transport system substrate-binding protein